MRRARPLSFKIRSSSTGRPRAIARCALCGRDGSVALPNGKDWGATTTAKLFSREGWDFDSHTARKCVCPPCIGERVRGRKGDKPPVNQKASPQASVPARTAQDLKPRDKAAVRHLLDLHFDDARGSYIDGYSDQRVGKECNVPWALVTAMRAGRLTPTGLGLARRYASLRARVVAGQDIEAWSDACAALQHKRNAWRTLNDVVDRGYEPAGQRFEEFMAALEALATVWGIPAETVWPVRPRCTSAFSS